jgi:outer membrane lipoprotein-sorting protein
MFTKPRYKTLRACATLALAFPAFLFAQTAEELVARNVQARGGIEKIKAIKTLRITGRFQSGGFTAQVEQIAKAPNLLRQAFTVQGMSQITAVDGSTGWKVSPFEGRKDPERLGEDELRPLAEDADFYGPLVDYKTKDNKIEYLGHDTVDGDDVYRLKVTLANGDILYYYLDPDTYMEIRVEKLVFVRGAVEESMTNLGSYKLVEGVYFPFSMEMGSKQNPGDMAKITVEKYEANIPVDASLFQMPAAKPAVGPKEF